ncbi:MAG: DUF3791 domain-containing protein [Treponema sp.]|nr:DUF3791 domain-containing protein [Treponema sp.]
MIANRTLVMHKCAHVVEGYAAYENVPLRQALDVFYKSQLYTQITQGISDMHCRSDGYLAEELSLELERNRGTSDRGTPKLNQNKNQN